MDIHNPTIIDEYGQETNILNNLGEVKMFALSISGAVTKANLQSNGWAICDGTTPASQGISGAIITSTPDLQHKFIRMSNDETSGGAGGSETHNHQWKSSASGTGYPIETLSGTSGGKTYDSSGNLISVDSSTSGHIKPYNYYTSKEDTKPPYYELVYFIKVK